MTQPERFTQLLDLITSLRAKNGCPWDKKQTPASIKKYLLEEASELAEAIDSKDPNHICEEIGDMFFILAILCQMFQEKNEFTADNALQSIIDKMTRRHPHVFADSPIGSEGELRQQWEEIKRKEGKTDPA